MNNQAPIDAVVQDFPAELHSPIFNLAPEHQATNNLAFPTELPTVDNNLVSEQEIAKSIVYSTELPTPGNNLASDQDVLYDFDDEGLSTLPPELDILPESFENESYPADDDIPHATVDKTIAKLKRQPAFKKLSNILWVLNSFVTWNFIRMLLWLI